MTLKQVIEKISGYHKIDLYDQIGEILVKDCTEENIGRYLLRNVIQVDLRLGYDDKGFDCVNMNVYLEE